MNKNNTIHGFSEINEQQATLKRSYLKLILRSFVPLVILVIIDFSKRFQVLVPFLLLVPLLDLKNQLKIWYYHIKKFGMPSLSSCWEMWRLDSLRGYDANSDSIARKKRRNVFRLITRWLFIAGLLFLLWIRTGFASILFLVVYIAVIAIKALIRRARPPAVLFLSTSNYNSSQLQLKIYNALLPLVVVSCLYHEKTKAELSDNFLLFYSYRTRDDDIWQEMVTSLVRISPIVIIDIRNTTRPIQFEISLVLETLTTHQLFFVGTKLDDDRIPPSRCFTEIELINELLNKLNINVARQSVMSTSGTKIYKDKKNGYFVFVPPAGWKNKEYRDPRTKVKFNHPSTPEVNITIIIKEVPAMDFQSIILADKERAHQMEAFGFSCKVEESEFLGFKCSLIMAKQKNNAGTTILRKFIAFGLHFNISYWAPTNTLFDKYLDEVMKSLNTITILKKNKDTSSKSKKQEISNRVRLAELMADHFSIDEAKRILEEAAIEFPDSKLIQDTIKAICSYGNNSSQADNSSL